MMLRRFLIACTLGAAACSGLKALSPQFGYVPPTYAERWDSAPFVVYGRVVGLERKATKEGRETYDVTFKIERCWKGSLSGDIVLEDALPDGMISFDRFSFEFYETYVLFAGGGDGATYRRHYAQLMMLPLAAGSSDYDVNLAAMIEEKTGDRLGAAEIKAQQAKKIRDEEAFVVAAKEELSKAIGEPRVLERKALLEALDKKLREPSAPQEALKLTPAVAAELSIVETFLSNGIKKLNPAPPTAQ
jgi:hypothetical protein